MQVVCRVGVAGVSDLNAQMRAFTELGGDIIYQAIDRAFKCTLFAYVSVFTCDLIYPDNGFDTQERSQQPFQVTDPAAMALERCRPVLSNKKSDIASRTASS